MRNIKTERDRISDEKKGKIMQASIELFKERGFQQTSIADISKATGFSVGSIYNFFGNKAGIIRGCQKQIYRESAEQLLFDKELFTHPKKVLLEYYMNIAEQLEGLGREISTICMHACSDEYLNGKELEYRDISLQIIETLFRGLEAEHKWNSELSVEKAAELVQMEYMGIVTTWMLFPIHESLKDSIHNNLTILFEKISLQ